MCAIDESSVISDSAEPYLNRKGRFTLTNPPDVQATPLAYVLDKRSQIIWMQIHDPIPKLI